MAWKREWLGKGTQNILRKIDDVGAVLVARDPTYGPKTVREIIEHYHKRGQLRSALFRGLVLLRPLLAQPSTEAEKERIAEASRVKERLVEIARKHLEKCLEAKGENKRYSACSNAFIVLKEHGDENHLDVLQKAKRLDLSEFIEQLRINAIKEIEKRRG